MAKLKLFAFPIRSLLVASVGALFLTQSPRVMALDWVSVGSAPAINGGDEGITSPEGPNPIAGAINSFAPSPTDANLIYVVAVNGGVWKTTNAKGASPKWVALGDSLPSLSLSAIAMSPLDPNTIFVGAGRSSSLASNGGAQFGLARSTNAGQTWTVVGTNIANQDVRSIVPTKVLQGGQQVVLVGAPTGVFRSIDGGVTYTQVSNGIPADNITDLVGDPGVNTRFYAGSGGKIFKSDDTGVSWSEVSTGTGFAVVANARILLSVHNSVGADVVYAAVISAGALTNVYRSADQGATWTALNVPKPAIFPGTQGESQGALLADRTNPNSVWISGDRQVDGTEEGGTQQFPNSLGATNYTGAIWRYVNGAWENAAVNGANGSSPHADSRAMLFDADGNILQSNDGGIYKLTEPNGTTNPEKTGTRRWSSLNGDISTLESHNATYDPISRVFLCGAQDNGVIFQIAPGNPVWNVEASGDGGRVEVDSDQSAHAGTSIRYSSNQNFSPFNRLSFDPANKRVGDYTTVKLNIASGPGANSTLSAFEKKLGFLQPFVVNQVDPKRLLIARKYIYESLDMGDNLANLGLTDAATTAAANHAPYQSAINSAAVEQGVFGDDTSTGSTAMAYGGRLNGTAFPDVFYIGSDKRISHRVATADPISVLTSYPGDNVRVLAMDPQNYKRIFVLDTANKVYTSVNEGVTWTDITANLATFTDSVRTIEISNTDPNFQNAILYAGGLGGVWKMASPTGNGTWAVESGGLPSKVLVYDLRYDYGSKILTAGTLGRGVYRFGAGPAVSPTPTPSPTPSPTATPATGGLVANVSTRLPVGTDQNVLIEGFIVTGPAGSSKKIIVRATGPSLVPFGITDALANPTLEIRDANNKIAENDNWRSTQTGGQITSDQSAEISASQLAPSNDLESAIIVNLAPGSYTAIVRGAGNSIGTGVVDAFDLSAASPARLANIATRGLIQPGEKLMIAGFIIQNAPARAVVRAVGPSLKPFGIDNALADTTLQLRDQNGAIVRENDDWQTDQKAELEQTGLQPSDPLEAAIVATIQPGQYTAQVRGKGDASGIGVVQVYFLQ